MSVTHLGQLVLGLENDKSQNGLGQIALYVSFHMLVTLDDI